MTGFQTHPGPRQCLTCPDIGHAINDHRTAVTQADAAANPTGRFFPNRPVGCPYTGCHEGCCVATSGLCYYSIAHTGVQVYGFVPEF